MTALWDQNLAALAARAEPGCRALAASLGERGPGQDLGLRDRGGNVVAGVVHQGRARSLASTFDSEKEALRWCEGLGGTVAVFGGAGRALAQALETQGVALAFWVEPRIEVWQSLFTWEDWTPWLTADRWVPVAGSADEWGRELRSRYHPLWDGAFQAKDWRSATQGEESRWEGYRAEALRSLELVASDTSTQARFGERWYRNTLANLKWLEAGSVPRCPGVKVVIAGAGPGLDDALDSREAQRWLEARSTTGDRLFSTDTALPALTARGVVPDLVLCLDGQLPTYHHFVPQAPRVPLLADLASLPLLGRLGMPLVRYHSGHPFSAVVGRFFPEIPTLDGSLGNVSGLALRTAQALGARVVEAWGVDFAYRDGQAYARGTYVYDLAQRRASRLEPLETRLGSSCYGARGRERTRDSQGRCWDTTPLLRDYHARWHAPTPRPAPVVLEHGSAGTRWEAFVEHWRNRLQKLPFPAGGTSVHTLVRRLDLQRRQDWLALWPLALSLHREGVEDKDLPAAVVHRALSFLQD